MGKAVFGLGVLAVVLIAWYAYYLFRIGRCGETDEEELIGVPARLAQLPTRRRRMTTVLVFAVAAAVGFAWWLRGDDGLGALLSSKVN